MKSFEISVAIYEIAVCKTFKTVKKNCTKYTIFIFNLQHKKKGVTSLDRF